MIPQFPNDSEHEIPEYTDAELAQMLADVDAAVLKRNAAGQMQQPTPEKPVTVSPSQPLSPDLPR